MEEKTGEDDKDTEGRASGTREAANEVPVSKAKPQKSNQTTDRKDLHGTRENILFSDHPGVVDGQSRHGHE